MTWVKGEGRGDRRRARLLFSSQPMDETSRGGYNDNSVTIVLGAIICKKTPTDLAL